MNVHNNLNPVRCDGWTRRHFLHVGLLSSLGLGAGDLLRWRAQAALPANQRGGSATSCILIWLDGGPSHVDLLDPKPDAPQEIRSRFGTVPTGIPGIHFGELLPKTARQMRHIALIRSLTHELGNHDTGTRYLLTGHRPTPSLAHPSLGSVVAQQSKTTNPLPAYVAIPSDAVGGTTDAARSGFLPGAWSAFQVGRDPSRVQDLHAPDHVDLERQTRRMDMLRKMDAHHRAVDTDPLGRDRDAFYEQAQRLLTSTEAKAAFDLEREPRGTREAYGNSLVGRSCLLARRLVEAGSRFITVVDTGWDMHQQIFRELPDSRFPGSGKVPALDQAYAALLNDLHERGLLESTLVVMMGEFGRTPKLNAQAGRDHWPRAGFVSLAGGGVQGGQVIGATDNHGESPVERPISPPDVACTVLRLLGINPNHELTTPSGRPIRILDQGDFIQELLS